MVDNGDIEVINDITVKVEGNTQLQDTGVAEGDTINLTDGDLTSSNILSSATIFGVGGSIPEYGTGYIGGPNDELSGSGYYSNIVNQISDHGTGYINGPNDELSGSGYYSNIENNIPDRGSLDDLTPGSFASSGYYSAGRIPESGGDLSYEGSGYADDSFLTGGDSISASVAMSDSGFIWNIVKVDDGSDLTVSGIGNTLDEYYMSRGNYKLLVSINPVDSGVHTITVENTAEYGEHSTDIHMWGYSI